MPLFICRSMKVSRLFISQRTAATALNPFRSVRRQMKFTNYLHCTRTIRSMRRNRCTLLPVSRRLAKELQHTMRTQTHDDCKAAFTFSRLKGTERSRTPVASKTAFEIEEGITAAAG